MRPATAADAERLAAIHRRAFPPPEVWDAAAIAGQLALPGVFGLIHDAGGMVLGRVAADEAEILTFAVSPESRRRGVGRDLLQAAMAQAALRGARAMFLEVAPANTAARLLYAQAGFAEVGRRPAYYCDGGDALILRASLLFESRDG